MSCSIHPSPPPHTHTRRPPHKNGLSEQAGGRSLATLLPKGITVVAIGEADVYPLESARAAAHRLGWDQPKRPLDDVAHTGLFRALAKWSLA